MRLVDWTLEVVFSRSRRVQNVHIGGLATKAIVLPLVAHYGRRGRLTVTLRLQDPTLEAHRKRFGVCFAGLRCPDMYALSKDAGVPAFEKGP